MATKAEKQTRTATIKSSDYRAETKARQYVISGLQGLGLSPNEKVALKEKLIPIVANRIKLDQGRTASRGRGIVAREAKARVAKASSGM
jgi:hypothetical protein